MNYLENEQVAELKEAYFNNECKEITTRYYRWIDDNVEEFTPANVNDTNSFYRVERDLVWNGKKYTLSISDDCDLAIELK